MSTPAGTVSVIICTRDRADSLRETLASVGACAAPDDIAPELIVVDNGSTDHTAAVVRAAGLANMPVRHLVEPGRGQTLARNAGLRASATDMVLFTDDDVRVPRDWLEGMCRPIFSGHADAVAGGVHFPDSYEALLAREPFRSRRGWFASSEGIDPARPRRMVGANMAFSRQVVAAIERFDPELGPGRLGFYDDTLFAARLLEAGFRLVAAPEISVEHRFDLCRLTRGSLLSMAERMGESEAYLTYHWKQDESGPGLGALWRARLLLVSERLFWPRDLLLGRVSPGELQRVQTLAYQRQLARLAGSPRRYPPAALRASR
jgi:glycosyltransferase involved in cell wall biosynthesis